MSSLVTMMAPTSRRAAEQLLGGGELRARRERRAEHDDHGLAREPERQLVDRRERRGALAELHGQAGAGRLVGVDDGDRDLRGTPAARRARARAGAWPRPGCRRTDWSLLVPRRGRTASAGPDPHPAAASALESSGGELAGRVVLGHERQVDAAALLAGGDPLRGRRRHVEGEDAGVAGGGRSSSALVVLDLLAGRQLGLRSRRPGSAPSGRGSGPSTACSNPPGSTAGRVRRSCLDGLRGVEHHDVDLVTGRPGSRRRRGPSRPRR